MIVNITGLEAQLKFRDYIVYPLGVKSLIKFALKEENSYLHLKHDFSLVLTGVRFQFPLTIVTIFIINVVLKGDF